jgi:hypothetical protein
MKVKSESADDYWKRNNTCVEALTTLILTKMTADMLRQITHGCGGDNAIEGINQQLQDECWKKLEHPEWFGEHGSPYYIKPYLALCVKLDLGEQAYAYLNNPNNFPHYYYEETPETPDPSAIKKEISSDTTIQPLPEPKVEFEPELCVGDYAVTRDGTFEVFEVRKSDILKDKVSYEYLLKTNEGNKWYHESAIEGMGETCSLGVPVQRACQDESCIMCEKRILKGEKLVCIDLEPEESDEEEAQEQEEAEEPKDTSRIPIILKITAKISKRELTPQNQHPISLDINGKAHPYVSSGSDFGSASSHDTVEEAKNSLQEWISLEKKWFTESYGRPIIVKLNTINEVNQPKQQNLSAYFG